MKERQQEIERDPQTRLLFFFCYSYIKILLQLSYHISNKLLNETSPNMLKLENIASVFCALTSFSFASVSCFFFFLKSYVVVAIVDSFLPIVKL